MTDWGKKFSERVNDFQDDENGVVAVIFALALLPIVALGAAGIDYALASNNKMNLDDAADVAALAGVRAASNYLAENPRATKAQWSKIAIKQAREIFRANSVGIKNVNVDNLDIKVGQEKFKIDLSVNYRAQSKTYFSKFLHVDSLPISNTSSASNSLPGYLQINFIVDISGSMGIGATEADQKKLHSMNWDSYSWIQRGRECSFACHYADYGKQNSSVALNNRYKNQGRNKHKAANLRIDIVRDSIRNMLQTFKNNSSFTGQFNVSLYTFSSKMKRIMKTSSNLNKAIAKTKKIEISPSNYDGGTNLFYALKRLSQDTPAGGDGLSSLARKTYTVIITDGVQNSIRVHYKSNRKADGRSYDHNFKRMYPADTSHYPEILQGVQKDGCDLLHDRNHNVIVMLTEYLIPAERNSKFSYIENVLKKDIQKNMVKCAGGEKNVFNVSSPQDIAEAGKKISSIISNEALRLVR